MSHPFDATLKELVRRYPLDWLAGLGLNADQPVRLLSADLATVSTDADTVLGIGDPLSSVVHIEFQSGRDTSLSRRIMIYNALLHGRFELPVHSTAVLLRKQADDPSLDGTLRYATHGGRARMDFRFEVVRVWERPASALLTGGLGMTPLAPLGQLETGNQSETALQGVLRRIDERLEAELPPAEAKWLLMAAWVLIGMRVPRSTVKAFQEAMAMVDLRESSTYQLILEEGLAEGIAKGIKQGMEKGMEMGMEMGMEKGEAEGLRVMLLQIGTRRFGLAPDAVREFIQAVDNVARLRRLGDRLLDVATWQELLDTL